jgi:hypothetical protein
MNILAKFMPRKVNLNQSLKRYVFESFNIVLHILVLRFPNLGGEHYSNSRLRLNGLVFGAIITEQSSPPS